MIKVMIKKSEKTIDSITISGHSGYDKSGKDIVCASVSSIAITTVNAMLRIDAKCLTYEENEGLLKIEFVKHTKTIDLLIENMLELFQELEQDYQSYVKNIYV